MSSSAHPTAGYCAYSPHDTLVPYHYDVRELREDDVHIQVQYCGICHSDIHMCKNEWCVTKYPIVPGHEVVGIVKAIGSKVTKYKVGDHVGVGCIVDSCGDCEYCKIDREQICTKCVQTYNGQDLHTQKITTGGYGRDVVCKESFVLNMRDLPLDKAAPLLCAGITTYSPIKYFGFDKPGRRIGVIGLGGLGHVAVMILKSFGALPVVISRSEKKRGDAVKLGAVDFVNSTNKDEMEKAKNSLCGIIDTVSAPKPIEEYMDLLKADGTLVQVGLPPAMQSRIKLAPAPMIFKRKGYAGSCIGGIKETQEMLDYCAEHKILPWTELVTMDKINEAFDRVLKSDIEYRFVLDIANSAPQPLLNDNTH